MFCEVARSTTPKLRAVDEGPEEDRRRRPPTAMTSEIVGRIDRLAEVEAAEGLVERARRAAGTGPQMKRIRSSRIRSRPKVISSWYSSARL